MIKIKTKYDYENNIFRLEKLKHNHSCSMEFLALIHKLIDILLENDEDLDKKEVYKILKQMDKTEVMEEVNAH